MPDQGGVARYDRGVKIPKLAFGLGSLAVIAFVACGGTEETSVAPGQDGGATSASSSSGGGPSGTLPCDVDAVLAKNCRQCHSTSPQYGAPMPLVTYADLHAPAVSAPDRKVYELVKERIHDDVHPMPQPPNQRLSAADTATIDAWVASKAPAGTSECTNNPTTDGGVAALNCTPDQLIRPGAKYTVPKTDDIYVCYGFDTNATSKRHVIAAGPRIDNTKVVHHVLLYQANATVSPTPTPCGAGGGQGWRLVTGWAPGGKNLELPPEAGFAEESGTTHWAIQIHYNNAQGLDGQTDETGYDLCSTDQLRPNDADILATGTADITIQPRSTRTSTCTLDVPAQFGNINVISSWAHMHRLGKAQYAKRQRNGEVTDILNAPSYDFNTGATAQNVRVDVKAGDRIETMCKWTNKTDQTVKFGEGTGDEMCFAFLTYYPKITQPGFNWYVPSLPILSKCTHVDGPP